MNLILGFDWKILNKRSLMDKESEDSIKNIFDFLYK